MVGIGLGGITPPFWEEADRQISPAKNVGTRSSFFTAYQHCDQKLYTVIFEH